MPLIDIYPVIARTLRAGLPAALLVLLAGSAPPHDRLASWEGRYAMDLRIGTETRVPVVGTERSVTRTLLLVDVRRDGGRWVQRQTVCDVGIQSGRVRMTVPDAFVSSMPRREYTSIVQGPGDERTYTADLGVESIGFDPRATGGTLPRNARSRGVLDSDHDGAPGPTGRGGVLGTDCAALGIPTEGEFVAAYSRAAGRPVPPELGVFLVFSMFRLASILAGVWRRALDGNAADPRGIGYRERYRGMAQAAWAIAGGMGR